LTNDSAPAVTADSRLRDVHFEIEQWLYTEAELLDERRFEDWLQLVAADVRYVVPLRVSRPRKDLGAPPAVQSAHMEDDKHGLSIRVKRIATGLAWSEDPPSMTRHLISNVRVRPAATSSEFSARSNFLIYVSRLEADHVLFAGERCDTLRRLAAGGSFELAERRVTLDASSLPAINFNIFF